MKLLRPVSWVLPLLNRGSSQIQSSAGRVEYAARRLNRSVKLLGPTGKAMRGVDAADLAPKQVEALGDAVAQPLLPDPREIVGPGDYTDNPAQMVVVNDGTLECPAILLTYDLSKKLQAAVKVTQEVEQAERQERAIFDDVLKRRQRIRVQWYELKARREKAIDANDQALSAAIGQVMEDVKVVQDEAEAEWQKADEELEIKYKQFFDKQAEANKILRQVLEGANLLKNDKKENKEKKKYPKSPAPTKVTFDLDDIVTNDDVDRAQCLLAGEAHIQAAFRNGQPQAKAGASSAFAAAVDDCISEYRKEEQLVLDYQQAQRRLYLAERALRNRHNVRSAEIVAMQKGERAYEDVVEFDLRHFQHMRALTQEIFAAEAAVMRAKQAAFDAGVDVRDKDQESLFGKDEFEYNDEDCFDPAIQKSQKMRAWLDSLPSGKESERDVLMAAEAPEMDDWDFGVLDPCDSVSVMFEKDSSWRKRIDVWRAGHESFQFPGSQKPAPSPSEDFGFDPSF
ncbi:hypothetical protein H2203_001114 [Taxawa tesnikishii (nom. ined.)]|nr:hypothetical protein H2203_001114 [Dothideales sp. JES 119]